MEDKIRKLSALFMGLLTLAVSVTAIKLSSARMAEAEAKEQAGEGLVSGMELMDYYTAQAQEKEEIMTHQMQIELPEGTSLSEIQIENNPLTQIVAITIPGIGQDFYNDHPILGSSSHIDNLFFGSGEDGGIIEITTNEVYEIEASVEDSWLFLDFVPPRERYEKVLVIDAGHGGEQPGAIMKGIYEKNLNLAILMELKALLDGHRDWKVYYTRTDDTDVNLDARVQLANKSHANLFVSIHNNSTAEGLMLDYDGTEVMYDEKKPEGMLGTKRFAQICLEETVAVTGSRNLGIARGNSIYIIRNSQVPVALVEAGFMTDHAELAKLNTPEYQHTVALGIYNGIVRALEEGF